MFPIPVVLLSLFAQLAVAETKGAPASAPRIRLTAPAFSGKRLVGVLVGLDETTLMLQQKGAKGALQVPRAAITKIEASRERSRRLSGAAIGMIIGLAASAVIGVAHGDDCGRHPERDTDTFRSQPSGGLFCIDRGEMALLSGIFIVPATTLLCLVASPGEKWEVASMDRLRIAVAPARGGGVRAALAIRF